MKRIGVLTSGGDAPGMNAAIRAVVRTSIQNEMSVIGFKRGYNGVLMRSKDEHDDFEMMTSRSVSDKIHRGGTFLRTARCLDFLDPQYQKQAVENLRMLGVEGLVCIGGDGTYKGAAALNALGVPTIGVPGTIDNDLAVTDHTPGYGSAAKYIATTVKELVRDSTIYDIRSATVVEIMGRNAGWLTAAAALARDEDCEGVSILCLPEVTFHPERFVRRVKALQRQSPSIVIAVSEGIRVADGRYVCELSDDAMAVDPFGHKYLGGTARYLCGLLGARLDTKTRAVELSTLQRCAAHTASGTDVSEACAAGSAAVNAAFEGQTGMMVALLRVPGETYRCEMTLHDVHGVANQEKTVPLDWIDAENYGIRGAFLDYVRPLISGELPPLYDRGLPRHLRLNQ